MWNKCISTIKPLPVDTYSSKIFNYIHKDVEEIEITNEYTKETYKGYSFFEAKIKKEDFEFFKEFFETEERSIENSDGILEVYEATDELSERSDTQEDAILELYEMIGGIE